MVAGVHPVAFAHCLLLVAVVIALLADLITALSGKRPATPGCCSDA